MPRHTARRWFSLLPGLLAWGGLVLPGPLAAQQTAVQDQLPEMGTAGGSTLSVEDEYRLGRMVMRGLRESGHVVDDPEIGEYLQSLGLRLSSQAHSTTSWYAIRRSTPSHCPAASSAFTPGC
jgi:predicted Zn-dependent protease